MVLSEAQLKRHFSGRRTNSSNPYGKWGIDRGGEGGNTMKVFLSCLLAYGGRQVAEGHCADTRTARASLAR